MDDVDPNVVPCVIGTIVSPFKVIKMIVSKTLVVNILCICNLFAISSSFYLDIKEID